MKFCYSARVSAAGAASVGRRPAKRFLAGGLLVLLALASAAAKEAKTFAGKVIGVTDGDTCDVRVLTFGGYEDHRVRLFAVDAPEVKHDRRTGKRMEWQPYGLEAAEELEQLVLGQSVALRVVSQSYGRSVGIVTRKTDGLDVNSELVKRGAAEVEPRYNRSQALRDFQSAARAERRGMWALDRHVPAWDWRRGKR